MDLNILEKILLLFFRHQIKIKMFHFQTHTYGGHKASDAYLETFTNKLDKFMEVGQGICGKFQTQKINININTLNDTTINDELDQFVKLLREFDGVMSKYTELLNLRDELIADAEQFKYLLTFK